MSGLGDIGLNVLFVLFVLFSRCFLYVFPLASLFCLFSLRFLIMSHSYIMHPEGSELDAALSIIYKKR